MSSALIAALLIVAVATTPVVRQWLVRALTRARWRPPRNRAWLGGLRHLGDEAQALARRTVDLRCGIGALPPVAARYCRSLEYVDAGSSAVHPVRRRRWIRRSRKAFWLAMDDMCGRLVAWRTAARVIVARNEAVRPAYDAVDAVLCDDALLPRGPYDSMRIRFWSDTDVERFSAKMQELDDALEQLASTLAVGRAAPYR